MRTTLLALAAALFPNVALGDEPTGQQLYKSNCARCHGATGEGTQKAPQPLAGDKGVKRLALVIDHTMPEDDPDKLDRAESTRVAEYIHDAFYSPVAQARLNPPRVELSRLTVKQYRNSVADLVGGFRPSGKVDDAKHGLRGEYFNARNFQNNKRLIDRTDSEVDFDFGTTGPAPGENMKGSFDPHQFSIRWEGSVLAPESGTYEFVVKTEHALRLWVNDARKPLIDGWVKSGSDTEFRASLPLLAGRAYTVRLEFSKAKQGVDDTKKNPNPPAKKASIALLWKRPHAADEIIPARHLRPARSPEVMVVEAAFPPDDRSFGWERGTTVSKEWEAATTEGAIEVATYVTARLPELANVPDGGKDRGPKLRDFCRRFAERAFRRPLTDDEKKLFIDRQFETVPDPNAAVKRVVLLVLKSPRFLYPDSGTAPGQFAVASRLALVLWDSLPDQALLDAAAADKLGTKDEVARQAERMLADPRAKAKVREFLLAWLKLDQAKDLVKDAKRYPGFDAALAADLRTSLELFLDDVIWGEGSDFRKLLLADELYLNERLATFYGAELGEDADGFTKVKFEADRRAGVLTHPYLLSALAYTGESSPIHRGLFVGRGLLGIPIRPPQEAFPPFGADLHPKLTTRERVSLQTKPSACATCHGVMNPLGFALEHFDTVGRYREQDHGKPVDSAGHYDTRAGDTAKFAGAKELARFLAASPEVHTAFATHLFHNLVKQSVRAYGVNRPEELRKSFSENAFSVRKLVVEIAVTAATKPPK